MFFSLSKSKSKSLSWDIIERAIAEEIKWLQKTIPEGFHKNKENYCKDCTYRRIASLIVMGKIKAKDIKSSVCLWGKEKSSLNSKPHGKDWHNEMMNLVYNYFKSLGFNLAIEPNLNKGRADLGIYKEGERNLLVEIGTVSLPKLLFNLESMEESDFLLVLGSNRVVKFSVLRSGYKYQAIGYE